MYFSRLSLAALSLFVAAVVAADLISTSTTPTQARSAHAGAARG